MIYYYVQRIEWICELLMMLMSNAFISLWHVTYDVKRKHVHDDFIAQSMVHEHGMEQKTMKGVKVPQTYEGD